MGMYTDERCTVIDGTQGCTAQLVRNDSGVPLHIEVWDEDYSTHLGNLPPDASVAVINAAAKFYSWGHDAGTLYGKAVKEHEIQQALGIPALIKSLAPRNEDR